MCTKTDPYLKPPSICRSALAFPEKEKRESKMMIRDTFFPFLFPAKIFFSAKLSRNGREGVRAKGPWQSSYLFFIPGILFFTGKKREEKGTPFPSAENEDFNRVSSVRVRVCACVRERRLHVCGPQLPPMRTKKEMSSILLCPEKEGRVEITFLFSVGNCAPSK